MASELPKLLRDHFDDPFHRGPCEQATHGGQAVQTGSKCELRMELAVDDAGTIVEAWFDGSGCESCEGLCSLVVERLEERGPRELQTLADMSESDFWKHLGLKVEELTSPCGNLPWIVLQKTIRTPLVELDEDLTDGTQFGGPSLREEC